MAIKVLYLVDGTSICYRAFYALTLSNSKGFPTGAIYGFYQTIKRILEKYNPEYLAVCFDVSRKTFRQEKFSQYKIQRPPVPDLLKQQVPLIKQILEKQGIAICQQQGLEADDIIASLTAQALAKDFSVVIVSSDKDMYQLLEDERVTIYNPANDSLIKKDDFIQERGFSPKAMVDFLALTGDNSDNIPGAKGIGKVSAAKLIQEFGTLENIFANLNRLNAKTKMILMREKENVDLSRDLIALKNSDFVKDMDSLAIKPADYHGLYAMFKELEFRKLLKELPVENKTVALKLKTDINLDQLLPRLKKQAVFYCQDDYVYILDNIDDGLAYRVLRSELKLLFVDQQILKITYGLKQQLNDDFFGVAFDVKIAAYLINSELADYSLVNLVLSYLDQSLAEIAAPQAPYYIKKIYDLLVARLDADKLKELFDRIEMPLVPVLYKMQKQGVLIDLAAINELAKYVEDELNNYQKQVFLLAGKEFNLNSPAQLAKVLFEGLKIKPLKKTKTGYSTNEAVLEKLAQSYPIAEQILKYRYLNKLQTTYVLPLRHQVKDNDGRLHSQFHQTQTSTGRLSSSGPNLQSIPIRGELSSRLRRCFISSFKPGLIFSADYSQIELRLLAHLSKDAVLIKAFQDNLDIHSFTASLLFGVDSAAVSSEQRAAAKKVNFGILYGMSAMGLAKELKISFKEAENFIQDYFLRYPQVKSYIDQLYLEAKQQSFVTTLFGRRRYLPDFNSANFQLADFSRRQAVNSPIQGSSADIIKLAMIKIDAEFRQKCVKSKLIMQIHDELVFDLLPQELDLVKAIVLGNMQNCVKLDVPLVVDLELGKNWGQMEKL